MSEVLGRGLRLTVGDQLDVEGRISEFYPKDEIRRSVSTNDLVFCGCGCGYTYFRQLVVVGKSLSSKKQEVIPVAEHIAPGKSGCVDYGIRRGTCFECIRE